MSSIADTPTPNPTAPNAEPQPQPQSKLVQFILHPPGMVILFFLGIPVLVSLALLIFYLVGLHGRLIEIRPVVVGPVPKIACGELQSCMESAAARGGGGGAGGRVLGSLGAGMYLWMYMVMG